MTRTVKFTIICLLAALTIPANSQINLKDKLKKAVNNASQSVSNSVKNKENNQGEQNDQKEPDKDQQAEQDDQGDNQASAGQGQPSLETFSKYDFVPGEKIIFFEDFSQDAIGDFPALWNTNGSAEVVTTNLFPGKWMKFTGTESIWTDQLLNLPDNYTIEFDVVPTSDEDDAMKGYGFRLMKSINQKSFDPGAVPGEAGFYFTMEYYGSPGYRTYINTDEGANLGLSGIKNEDSYKQKLNQKYHMALWIQKARVRLYQDETKLFDLPRAFNVTGGVKMDRLRFEEGSAMVTNIRVAVGAPDTRNKLITEGRLVTYGIYFDVNKDVIKPESYATLKEIAAVLSENPGVRVKIIGHTDSDGDDAANLDLSRRRAESVRNELAKTFGIDASRFEADGLGETKPVAPNDTPVNKALNRRVEFVKL